MEDNLEPTSGDVSKSIAADDKSDPMEDRSFFQRISDRFFGFDFFISYCWADGRHYAVELQRRLEGQGFNCFLDSSDYAKGDNWRAAGQRALKKTSRLILVGTPRAVLSEPVANELRIFSGLKRRVFPIDFGGALAGIGSQEGIFRYLDPDMLRVIETENALVAGPSEDVLNQIHGSFNLLRQNQKRVRWFAAMTMVFAAVAVAAVVASFIAKSQSEEAKRKTIEVRETLSENGLGRARESLESGRINGALHRMWDAYDNAPEGSWRRGTALRLMRAWLPDASHVVRPATTGAEMMIAPGGRQALMFGPEIIFANESLISATLVDTATGEVITEFNDLRRSHLFYHPCMAFFSPDGNLLICSKSETQLVVLHAHDGSIRNTLELPSKVSALAIRNEREIAVLLEGRPDVTIHDLQNGNQLITLPFPRAELDSSSDMIGISGDGTKLLANFMGTTAMWDIDSQRPLPMNGGFNDGLFVNGEFLTLNQDGSLAVAIDGVVGQPSIWTTDTGEESWRAPTTEDGYFTTDLVLFHPTEPGLAAIGFNDTVELVRVDQWNEHNSSHRIEDRFVHEGVLTGVAFSEEGDFLVSSDDSSGIQFSELSIRKAGDRSLKANDLATGSDLGYIFRSTEAGIHIVDSETGKLLGPKIDFIPEGFIEEVISDFVVSRDGKRAAVVVSSIVEGLQNEDALVIFETQNSRIIGGGPISLSAKPDGIFFSNSDSRVVAVSRNSNQILTWDSETGDALPVVVTDLESADVYANFAALISVAENGDQFAQAAGNSVSLWQMGEQGPRVVASISLDENEKVSRVEISPDGTLVAVSTESRGGRISIWNIAGELVSGPIRAEGFAYQIQFAFSPDGTRFAVSKGGDLNFYDSKSGRRLIGPLRHRNLIGAIEFSPDGTCLAAVCGVQDEGISFTQIRLWDVESGIPVGPGVRRTHQIKVSFTEDGSQLLFVSPHGQEQIELWGDFSPISDAPERLRLTLELMTGWSFGEKGSRIQLSAPATRQRWGKLEALGGPIAHIPVLPEKKTSSVQTSVSPAVSQQSEPVAPVPVPNPVEIDSVHEFVLKWIAAGNSADTPPVPQFEFYVSEAQIDDKLISKNELAADQEGFEKAFPKRVFTYLDHEVLASRSDKRTALVVHQHVFLSGKEGAEREIEVKDELVVLSINGELKIESRKRIDTQKIR